MSRPLVSVLTPSFGYGRFIGDALESVLKQSLVQTESIVQDGGSQDDTVRVLTRYDKRIDWDTEPDTGQSDALNRALSRAGGDWIAWLNADEFYLPDAISYLVDAGTKHDADVVYGDAVFVDESGLFQRLLPQHRFNRYVLRSYGPFISSCSALFRREALGVAPWNEQCRRIMDYELYLRLLSEGRRFLHVPVPVGVFRVHDARVTAEPAEQFSEEYTIVKRQYGLTGIGGGKLSRGRIGHGVLKLIDGSYSRQRKAHHLSGKDIRWFRGPRQEQTVRSLIQSSYPELRIR